MPPAYPTPEWLDTVARVYRSDPQNKETLKRLNMELAYRIAAEPEFGWDKDLYFNFKVEVGELLETRFVTAEEAQRATLLMGAPYEVWKNVLTKRDKYIAAFMTKRIRLENGNPQEALKLGPVAAPVVDIMTKEGIAWPDEMSPDELNAHRANIKAFREKLGV